MHKKRELLFSNSLIFKWCHRESNQAAYFHYFQYVMQLLIQKTTYLALAKFYNIPQFS